MYEFNFQPSHLFFAEALQFFAIYVTGAFTLGCDFTKQTSVRILDGQLSIELRSIPKMLPFFKGEAPEPTELSCALGFNEEWLLAEYSHDPPPQRMPVGRLGPRLCVYLLGFAQETHSKRLTNKLGKDVRKWPSSLQLFFHVRNGCFHNNIFDIWKEKIDIQSPPTWVPGFGDCLRIDDLAAINGRKVVGDFLRIPQVLPLLHDMGIEIEAEVGR